MGWINGLPISVGTLANQIIGFSNMGGGGAADFNITTNNGGRYDTQQLIWDNTEFDKQIDISEYFTPDHADFNIELAGINIVDENKNVTARFVCRLSKSGNQWHLNNRLENPSGAVIAYIMRSQSGNVTLIYDNSGNYATGIYKVYLALSVSTYQNTRAISWVTNLSQCGSQYGNYYWGKQGLGGSGFLESQLWETFGIAGHLPEPKTKSPEFGPAAEPGGYGGGGSPMPTHNHGSDHNKIPSKPQYGFTSAGFLNHYNISSQGLSMLGEALFPAPIGSSPDMPTAIDRLTANLWNSKIIDYVIDCRIVPVKPHDDGYHNITCGGKVLVHPTTQAIYQGALIDEDFVDVDCGYVETPPTEGNFLDYYQMSCKLFLPFYGYVDIAPEYWNGAKIGVYYRFNMMDGSFMVWVTSKAFASDLEQDDIIAQYAGNACIHLPINSMSYSNIISGMITTGAAIVGAAAGGAAGVGAAQAAKKATAASISAAKTSAAVSVGSQVASGASNLLTTRPQLNNNNSYNGSASLMSARKPHLLIEFNNAQFSPKYVDEQGLPLVVEKRIGSLTGMVVCDNPVLNFGCTEEIGRAIIGALQEGVIV